MGWMIQCLNPSRDKRFFSPPKCPRQLWDIYSLGSLPVVKQPGSDFDHHLHQKLRSKEVELYL